MSLLRFLPGFPLLAAFCFCLVAFPLPAQPSAEKSQETSPADSAAQDQYVSGYVLWQEAEKLNQSGDGATAYQKYQQGAQILDRLAQNFPAWQPNLVKYRREEIGKKMTDLQKKVGFQAPGITPATAAAPATPATAAPNAISGAPPPLAPDPVNPSASELADLLMPPVEQINPGLSPASGAGENPGSGVPEDFLGQMQKLLRASQDAQESARMMAESIQRIEASRKAADSKAAEATNKMLLLRGAMAEKDDAIAARTKELEQLRQGIGANQQTSTAAQEELTKQRDELYTQLKKMRDEFQTALDDSASAMKELDQ